MGPPFLVPAGDVSQQWAFLREPLAAKFTAEGALTCVGPIVFIQACLGAECLAAEVALEGFLSGMGPKVHVQVGLLGEGMVAELTHIRPLIPVLGFDVHLQTVATRGPVAAFLTDKQFLPTMFEGFVQAEFCPRQEAFGTRRARMRFWGSMQLDQMALQVLLLHELLDAGRALIRHLSCVGHHVHPQFQPPLEHFLADRTGENLLRTVHAVPRLMLQQILLPEVAFPTLGTFKGLLSGVLPVVHFEIIFAEK